MSIKSSNTEETAKSKAVLPPWLKRPIAYSGKQNSINQTVHLKGLHTVCVEAKCPNRGECYSRGVATFLIMGNICTRNCRFCNISHGIPDKPDCNEPAYLTGAVKNLKLKHVVITSVTRDDLEDGGASHYALIVNTLKKELPLVTIELLIPDFCGKIESLDLVLSSHPDVLNHNVETVPRLYPLIRAQAQFERSLGVILHAAKAGFVTKSGLMVGLGETPEEIIETMKILRDHGCAMITIGQYLQPSADQIPVAEFIHPDQFDIYAGKAKEMGFIEVFAGPFVRSSYRAEQLFSQTPKKEMNSEK